MTIKQLFNKVEQTNEVIKPISKCKVVITFNSDLPSITSGRQIFNTYERFEQFIRTNFRSEADKLLNQRFNTVRERFHFDNKGYLSLIITKEEV